MIYERITEVTVCALPEDSINHDPWSIQVAWRGGESYAVVNRFRQCLSVDGKWSHEPMPSSRTERWIAAHRFDYQTALRLACEEAPRVVVNGKTAAQVAEWEAGRAS